MVWRFKRLGMQKRMMLYVAAGLVVLFGAFAVVGFLSVREATQLVYEERLATAYTVAGIMERDFLHVARDVHEVFDPMLARGREPSGTAAQELLSHLSETDPFPFFRITGVWVVARDGRIETAAGEPEVSPGGQVAQVSSWMAKMDQAPFLSLPAVSPIPDAFPFATMLVRLGNTGASPAFLVAVHTVSVNSSAAYKPEAYWRAVSGIATTVAQKDTPEPEYHLEVVDANGLTVLGIGEGVKPGETSPHFPMITEFAAQRQAAAVAHEPSSGDAFSAHVMAIVPLDPSPFYVLLEQPVDVALALPGELRRRILLATTLGFGATLLVAWWITRRQVVKPTEQLTEAARRMAKGDLETPINVSAQDEVETLAASLEAMRMQLRDAYQAISRAKGEAETQVKQRTARLTEALSKIISAQEQERRRLARELHDETAQTIGALSIALDRARYGLKDSEGETVNQIHEAQGIVRRLLEETRRLILDLRPLALEDLGLVPAIRWYAETHLEEQGVRTTVEVNHQEVRLPPHLEVALFRIVQEAINNIVRHAEARHARIELSFHDSVASVLVADDGKGFNVDRVFGTGTGSSDLSFGLLGMQERTRLLNGRLDIRSEQGKGTQVVVEVPFP
ncbi:MAG: HAMP domain-containing protein [Chloroflexi bacterium]|nr:HAMP domain-containing protein [Chloroflexota bacterium]